MIQILLYLLIIGAGYWIYRRFLVSFRYTVTTEELIVDQMIGGRQKSLLSIPLGAIIRTGNPERVKNVRVENAYVGRKADTLMVLYGQDQKTGALFISAGETLRTILAEQTDGKRSTVETD